MLNASEVGDRKYFQAFTGKIHVGCEQSRSDNHTFCELLYFNSSGVHYGAVHKQDGTMGLIT